MYSIGSVPAAAVAPLMLLLLLLLSLLLMVFLLQLLFLIQLLLMLLLLLLYAPLLVPILCCWCPAHAPVLHSDAASYAAFCIFVMLLVTLLHLVVLMALRVMLLPMQLLFALLPVHATAPSDSTCSSWVRVDFVLQQIFCCVPNPVKSPVAAPFTAAPAVGRQSCCCCC